MLSRNDKIQNKISGKLKEEMYIYYPTRYHAKGFAGDRGIMGLFIISDVKGQYCLVNIPIYLQVNIDEIMDEKIDDVDYKRITVYKGNEIFTHNKYIPTLDIPFDAYEDFYIKSNNVPFYVTYEDIVTFFIRAYEYTGFAMAEDFTAITISTAIVAVDSQGNNYRTDPVGKVSWVGMSDKTDPKNLMSAISAGTYLDKGINGAILMDEHDETNAVKTFDS